MKVFKKHVTALLLSGMFLFISCSECNNENPRARVTNFNTEEVSLQIKTTGGNTENLNNIESKKSSEFKSYSPGEITFIITQKNNKKIETSFDVDFCTDYEVILNEDDSIEVIPETRE